jgi:hypothetical protein
MTHLFTISEDIWDSIGYDTIIDTAIALEKAGLDNPPYDSFDIRVTLNHRIMSRLFPGWRIEKGSSPSKTYVFRYDYKENSEQPIISLKLGDVWYSPEKLPKFFEYNGMDGAQGVRETQYISSFLKHTLVSLLATKNADKVTDKIKKHGPKSRKRPREYDYITTIKIGKITETMRSEGDGHSAVRPHLRRGHIRNQRVGKGLSEIKPIFIAPCFINADENWINNQRKEYRLVA